MKISKSAMGKSDFFKKYIHYFFLNERDFFSEN